MPGFVLLLSHSLVSWFSQYQHRAAQVQSDPQTVDAVNSWDDVLTVRDLRVGGPARPTARSRPASTTPSQPAPHPRADSPDPTAVRTASAGRARALRGTQHAGLQQ